jgi:hypothetical protein
MGLIAPSLRDLSLVFFGKGCWPDSMARALDVEPDELETWNKDPSNIPPDLEERLKEIGAARIGEIQAILALVTITGVRRAQAD